MKRSLKATACLCALIMAASAMPAIGAYAADTAEKPSASAEADTKKPEAKNVKHGKVTAVNGSEITLALGDTAKQKKDSAKNDGTAAEAKEKPSGKQKTKPTDNSKADKNDTASGNTTENAKTKPEGKRGGKHKGGKSGEFTENGTTVTVTLSDNITLTKNGKAITAADISVGDILTLKYNDSGELVGIKVKGQKSDAEKSGDTAKAKGSRKNKKAGTEQTASV